jgi:GntR family transcriptional regulator
VIRIDVDSAKPIEEQIVAELRRALAQGSVGAGDELPSVRQLAGDLGVHWNTVARAYRRLADEGVLLVRRGRTAVVGGRGRTTVRMTRASLRDRLSEVVAAALVGGMSRDDVARVFTEALSGFPKEKQ